MAKGQESMVTKSACLRPRQGFFFFFLRGSPRYYIGANRTLPSTHAIGYVGKPVRVGARRALPQEDNAIPKRSASMKAYHRKATPSDGHVPSTRG